VHSVHTVRDGRRDEQRRATDEPGQPDGPGDVGGHGRSPVAEQPALLGPSAVTVLAAELDTQRARERRLATAGVGTRVPAPVPAQRTQGLAPAAADRRLGGAQDLLSQAPVTHTAPLPMRPYRRVGSHPAQALVDALDQCGGNKSRAAQQLGMTARQFSYRWQKLGLPND